MRSQFLADNRNFVHFGRVFKWNALAVLGKAASVQDCDALLYLTSDYLSPMQKSDRASGF